MGWNSGLMTLPIGWGDISQATGVGGPPYDLATMIGNSSIINKWALHKPVMLITGYDTPADISADGTWLTYMKDRVRETDNNVACPFALKVTSSINLNDVIGVNSAPAVDWVYQKPPTSGSFWRRSHDFNHYTNTPNVPMNQPSTMTFYSDSTNVLVIDTNDGEASNTSIQVSMLTQLQSYRLMLVVRVGSLWYLCVMSTTIANSVSQGTIDFTLPTSGAPSAGTYDAYLVGLTTSANVATNSWFTQTSMTSFYNMIPLPFASKDKCKFTFKVASTAPTNVVNIAVVFRMTSAYVLRSIEFHASKYGAITNNNTFTLALYNIDVRNDNDEVVQRLNTTVRIDGPWDYDSTTRQASKTVTLDVSSYNINAGDYPNIICASENNRGFTVNAPYTDNVIFV